MSAKKITLNLSPPLKPATFNLDEKCVSPYAGEEIYYKTCNF